MSVCYHGYPFKQSYYYYSRGLIDVQQKNYKSAIKNFEKVIEYDPYATDVYPQLINLYILEQQQDKLNILISTITKVVSDTTTLVNIAEVLTMFGYTEPATVLLEKILQIDPGNKKALLTCAQFYYETDPEKSLMYYKKYAELYPEDSNVYLFMSLLECKLGNLNNAKECLKKIQTEDESLQALVQLFETLLSMTTDYNLLESSDIEKIISTEEYSTVAFMLYSFTIKGELDKAKKCLDKLLTIPKKKFQPVWYFYIATYYEFKGEPLTAAKYLKKYCKTTKDETEVIYIKLGYYYALAKKYKKAEQIFNKAKVKFNTDTVKTALLYLYMEEKKYKHAAEILHELEKSTTSINRINFYLGVCYDQLGNFKQAEYYLKKAIEQKPDDHESLNYLGYLYADKNINLDEAEKLIQQALTLEPTNYAYIDSLAWVYYRKQMYDKAEELFERIKDCNDPIVYEHIGDTKYILNKLEEAINFYNRAVKLNRKNKNLRKKLKEVQNKLRKKN